MIEPIVPDERFEPSTDLLFNDLQISTRIIPAGGSTHGGDWCEAFALSEEITAISIGDICGHGDATFAAMVAIRQEIRNAAAERLDPAHVLRRANDACYKAEPGEIATAIFALLNTRERSLIFANAGHPPPLMVGPFGSLFLENTAPDLPLGVEVNLRLALSVIAVPAAALFVFYTDGVIENNRDALQGAARLLSAANLAPFDSDVSLAESIERLMQLTPANGDDVAILTARSTRRPVVRKRQGKGFARRANSAADVSQAFNGTSVDLMQEGA